MLLNFVVPEEGSNDAAPRQKGAPMSKRARMKARSNAKRLKKRVAAATSSASKPSAPSASSGDVAKTSAGVSAEKDVVAASSSVSNAAEATATAIAKIKDSEDKSPAVQSTDDLLTAAMRSAPVSVPAPVAASSDKVTTAGSAPTTKSDRHKIAAHEASHPSTTGAAAAKKQKATGSTSTKSKSTSSSSSKAQVPFTSFADLGLVAGLTNQLMDTPENGGMGLLRPKLVQKLAVPPMMQGRDVVIRSQTGSGKTLAFLIPLVHNLAARAERVTRSDGLYALMMSPTRELCFQIADVLALTVKRFHWIVCSTLVGGEKKKSEKARMRKGVNVLVATPGRVLDHLKSTKALQDSLVRRSLRWLVLDEADRLMDSGFSEQMDQILDLIATYSSNAAKDEGRNTQTVLVSATVSKGVTELSGRALVDPVVVVVGKKEVDADEAEARRLSAKKSFRKADREDGDDGDSSNDDDDDDDDEGGVSDGDGVEVMYDSDGELVMKPQSTKGVVSFSDADDSECEDDKPKMRNGKEQFNTPKQLTQYYMLTPARQRLVVLAAFIRRQVRLSGHTCKMVLFVSCRAVVDFLHVALSGMQWPPIPKNYRGSDLDTSFKPSPGLGARWWKLHGSVNQTDRRNAVKEFGKAKGGVLICTDVAARGLDLPSVDWVVQFDAPSEVSEYVHRVGRTARNGHRGAAVLFLRDSELEYVQVLSKRGLDLGELKVEPVVNSLLSGVGAIGAGKSRKKAGNSARAQAMKDPQAAAQLMQIKFEDLVQANGDDEDEFEMESRGKAAAARGGATGLSSNLLLVAQDAYLSSLRAYAVHAKDSKYIFQPKKLHLGHEARAFGLREQPKGITGQAKRKLKEVQSQDRAGRARNSFKRGAKRLDAGGDVMERAAAAGVDEKGDSRGKARKNSSSRGAASKRRGRPTGTRDLSAFDDDEHDDILRHVAKKVKVKQPEKFKERAMVSEFGA